MPRGSGDGHALGLTLPVTVELQVQPLLLLRPGFAKDPPDHGQMLSPHRGRGGEDGQDDRDVRARPDEHDVPAGRLPRSFRKCIARRAPISCW
ncbi:MAG: hypothetical protein JWO38_1304 [Gemmataceae bacterium]|nr:hypothetical protein [Gemmataceae bacterium]